MAVGDVNGDRKLDVVVGNKCSDSGCSIGRGSLGVLLGNGDGTFQRAVTYDSGGYYAQAVAIADLNGDHKLDIVAINSESNTVGVLLGNGNGTFQPAVIYGSGGNSPWSVAVADVNGDSSPDIIATSACNYSNCDGISRRVAGKRQRHLPGAGDLPFRRDGGRLGRGCGREPRWQTRPAR